MVVKGADGKILSATFEVVQEVERVEPALVARGADLLDKRPIVASARLDDRKTE